MKNIMKNIPLLSLIVLLVAAAGCQPASYPQQTQIKDTPVVSGMPTARSLLTPQATSPSLGGIFDPTYVPKSRRLQNHLNQSCIAIKTALQDAANLNATLVLYDRLKNISYTQTLPSAKKATLTDVNRNSVDISPNRQWVAYMQAVEPGQKPSQFVVQSFDGKVQKKIKTASMGQVRAMAGWLNNEYIVFKLAGNEHPSALTAINPFTNEQKSLSTDFPYIWDNDPWDWEGWGRTLYSPNFRYVIYPSADSAYGGNTPVRDVLWDTNSQKEITATVVGITGNLTEIPQWDESGKLFAVEIAGANVDDLYSANVDGTITQLTNMLNLFPNVVTQIRSWSWSPDSRLIAFWLDIYTNNSISISRKDNPLFEERLMVLNVDTGDITDYCIPANSIEVAGTWPLYIAAPIWSPDGKSLLVENFQTENQSRLIVVDLSKNIGYEIAKDVYPFGWMISRP